MDFRDPANADDNSGLAIRCSSRVVPKKAGSMTDPWARCQQGRYNEPQLEDTTTIEDTTASINALVEDELRQIQGAGHHRTPASTTKTTLKSLQDRLINLLNDTSLLTEELESLLNLSLAEIHEELGAYDEAESPRHVGRHGYR